MLVILFLVIGTVFGTIFSFVIACIADINRRKRARAAEREQIRQEELEELKTAKMEAKRREELDAQLVHLEVKRERLLSVYDTSTIRQQIALDDAVFKIDRQIDKLTEELEGL